MQWAASFTTALNRSTICKRRPQCHRFSALFQKDAPKMTDAEFSVCTVSFTKGQNEERPCTIAGRRKNGEMAGLGSANGQAPNCMI